MAIMALPLVCLWLYRSLNKDNAKSTEMEDDDAAAAAEGGEEVEAAPPPKKNEKFCNRHLLQHIVAVAVLFNEQVVQSISDCVGLLLEFIQSAQVVTSLTTFETQ